MAKESLKLAPSESEQKPSKEHFEAGDKCVYPSEVSVMELKKKKKGLNHIHMHTHTQTHIYNTHTHTHKTIRSRGEKVATHI